MGFAIGAASGAYGGAFVFLGCAAVVYLVGSMIIDFERPIARA
jgi:MFS transporter, ACS family, D-galactonate transporter